MIQVCWRKNIKLFFGCCRYQGIFLERVSILCANGVFCVSPQVVGADDVASVLEGGSSLLYGHLGRMLEGFNRDLIPVLRAETAANHQNRWIITSHNLKMGDFCFVDVLAFSKQAFWASILVFLGDILVDIRERPHGSDVTCLALAEANCFQKVSPVWRKPSLRRWQKWMSLFLPLVWLIRQW